MKIALLLSGKLNTFDYPKYEFLDKWKSIIHQYNIDTFCVTDDDNYFSKNLDCQVFTNKDKFVNINESSRRYEKSIVLDSHISYIEIKNILNKLGNKLIDYKVYEDSFLNREKILIKNKYHKYFINYESHQNKKTKLASLNQFYKLYKCLKLLTNHETKNNFRYDLIIRSRFDCFIDLNKIPNIFDSLKFFCGYSYNCNHIYDWWGIGDSYIMKIYSNYYKQMSSFLFNGNKHYIKQLEDGNWIQCDSFDKKLSSNQDISLSTEVGLTHLVNNNKYQICPNFNYHYASWY